MIEDGGRLRAASQSEFKSGMASLTGGKYYPHINDYANAARRDQLLAFADDLGLQLFVSSPDQDGVKREIKHSVSLIVIKDENLDVHLTPVVWRNVPAQADLLSDTSPEIGMTIKEETR